MYNWLEKTLGVSEGLAQGMALVISLAVVLVLFGLFIMILKRLTLARSVNGRSRQPRIAVMDSAAVDARRRLILIRRDNIEHLILVGGPSDVVVEQNIVRGVPVSSTHPRPMTAPLVQPAVPVAQGVKAPLASGPDLPMTPADGLPDGLADLPAPTPPVPEPRAAQPAAASPQREAPRPLADVRPPLASRPADAKPHSSTVAPVPTAAAQTVQSAPAAPVVPAPLPRSDVHELRKPNPAADLLRAATANGFSRVSGRRPGQDLATDLAAAPSDTDASVVQGLAEDLLEDPQAKPVAPVYKITPPASGPAARATTAIPMTAASKTAAPRVEPPALSPMPAPRPALSPTAARTAAGPVPAPEPAPAEVKADAPADEESAAPISETALEAAQQAPTETLAPREPQATSAAGDQRPGSTSLETASDEESIEKELALEEAITDEAKTEAPVEALPPQTPEALKQPEVKAADEGKVEATAGEPAPAAAPAVRIDPAYRPAPMPEKRAADTPALGEKNPIEDEMARILDELHGTQKR